MISRLSHSENRFATRHWSVVLQFGGGEESSAVRDALGELAQRYFYPAYAYIRSCGSEPAEAQHLAEELLHRLVAEHRAAQPVRGQSHFRQFLLAELRALVAERPRAHRGDRAAGDEAKTASLEARYRRDHPGEPEPEQAFQRSYARVVLQRALQRLRGEAEQTGHEAMYRALEPYLAREPTPAQLELLLARLHLRQVGLVLALKRLRQRLRELAADELADTVGSADDLDSEQQVLLGILREMAT